MQGFSPSVPAKFSTLWRLEWIVGCSPQVIGNCLYIFIFLNDNVWISIKFSLKFVPKIKAWRRSGLAYWRIYASLGPIELPMALISFSRNITGLSSDRWRVLMVVIMVRFMTSGRIHMHAVIPQHMYIVVSEGSINTLTRSNFIL